MSYLIVLLLFSCIALCSRNQHQEIFSFVFQFTENGIEKEFTLSIIDVNDDSGNFTAGLILKWNMEAYSLARNRLFMLFDSESHNELKNLTEQEIISLCSTLTNSLAKCFLHAYNLAFKSLCTSFCYYMYELPDSKVLENIVLYKVYSFNPEETAEMFLDEDDNLEEEKSEKYDVVDAFPCRRKKVKAGQDNLFGSLLLEAPKSHYEAPKYNKKEDLLKNIVEKVECFHSRERLSTPGPLCCASESPSSSNWESLMPHELSDDKAEHSRYHLEREQLIDFKVRRRIQIETIVKSEIDKIEDDTPKKKPRGRKLGKILKIGQAVFFFTALPYKIGKYGWKAISWIADQLEDGAADVLDGKSPEEIEQQDDEEAIKSNETPATESDN